MAAPIRSAPYTTLTRLDSLEIASDTTEPPVRKGSAASA